MTSQFFPGKEMGRPDPSPGKDWRGEKTDCYTVTRKPVFGVFDQVRLKLACSAAEASKSHENANIET